MAEQYIYKEALAATLKTHFPGIEYLKPQQEDAIIKFMQRRDVFAVLPTGWGKSLIFQIVPAVCSHFHDIGLPFEHKAIVLVVCPLNSLVESHMRELDKLGMKACSLSGENIDEEGILAGRYSFVFTSPEAIINNEIAQFYIARNFRITYSTVILAFIQFLWSFGGCRSFFHLYYYTVI
jgi:ATP-dependent DNA helicase RecQ